MKKIISLTKVLYKINKNDSGKLKKKNKIILYTALIIYILFVFMNFWNLFLEPLENIGKSEAIFPLIFGISSIFVFTTSITYVANVLYFSKDIENILPLPFKPREIFTSKLLIVYLFDILIVSMLVVPGIITCGQHMNVNIVFYLYSAIIFLLIPVIPLALITIAYTIIMQFLKLSKHQNFFKIATTMLILFIVIAFQIGLNSTMTSTGEYDSQAIYQMSENINEIMPYYLKVAVNALCNYTKLSGLAAMTWFLVINVVAISMLIFLFNKLYLKGVINNLNSNTHSKFINDKEKFKQKSLGRTLVSNDIKKLFRNVTYFIQCILPIFLVPIIILVIIIMSNTTEINSLMNEFENIKIMLGVVIIQFFMMLNYISTTAFSRDGIDEICYLKTLPIAAEKIIVSKTVPSVIFGIFGIIISIFFGDILFSFNLIEKVALFVIGMLLNTIQSYLFIIIDLLHPKLKWKTEIAVVKQNINIFYGILVEFAMIISTSLIANLLIPFGAIYFVVLYIVLCVMVCVILKIVVKKYAVKLYEKLK